MSEPFVIDMDTRENKSRDELEITDDTDDDYLKLIRSKMYLYQIKHPKKFKEFRIRLRKLPVGDFHYNARFAELKIGKDAEHSLKSGHFKKQMGFMKKMIHDFPQVKCLAIMCEENSLDTYKWFAAEADMCGVHHAHRYTLIDAIEEIVSFLTKDQKPEREEIINFEDLHKKTLFINQKARLATALSIMVDNLSVDFATFLIKEEWLNWRDVVENINAAYVNKMAHDYYKANREKLGQDIDTAVGVVYETPAPMPLFDKEI